MKQTGNRKELNAKQAKSLCRDILNQQVKRFGGFVIGQYFVTVYNKVALTSLDRINNYYKLNPDKLVERYNKRKEEYHLNKKKGICVRCGKRKAQRDRAQCKKCKDKYHRRGKC